MAVIFTIRNIYFLCIWLVYVQFSSFSFELFSLSSIPETGIYHQPLTFKCDVNASFHNVTAVLWELPSHQTISISVIYHNESCIVYPGNSSYSLTCDVRDGEYNLSVPGSHMDSTLHNTSWKCSDPSGPDMQSLPYKLYVSIMNVSLTTPRTYSHLVTVEENQQFTFKCTTNEIRPAADINWFLGTDILPANETTISVHDDLLVSYSMMNYTGHRMDNGKTIHCDGRNLANMEPIVSNNITLEISYGPEIVVFLPNYTTMYLNETDSSEEIICQAACSPICTFKWKGPSFHMIFGSVLKLYEVDSSHAGNYRCIANNSISEKESDLIKVVVNYRPMTSIRFLGTTQVNENETVQITCEVQSVPKSMVTLHFKDSVPKTNRDYPLCNATYLNDSQIYIYIIDKVTCLQMGMYSCQADNIVGHNESNEYLTVLCTPRINNIEFEVPKRIVIPNNKPINISIPIIGFPKPNISWIHNKIDFTKGQVVSTIINENRHMYNLVIMNPSKDDFGLYEIFSLNNQNETKFLYQIEVVRENITITTNITHFTTVAAGVISGIAILVFVTVIVYEVWRKRFRFHKVKDRAKQQLSRVSNLSNNDSSGIEDGLIDNILYISADDVTAHYRPNNALSSVDKQDKNQESTERKQQRVYSNIDNPDKPSEFGKMRGYAYANTDIQNNGLVYADLEFENTNGKPFVIRGIENKTTYEDIDFDQKADPLPSDDDDEDDKRISSHQDN